MEMVHDCYGAPRNDHVLLSILPFYALRIAKVPDGPREGRGSSPRRARSGKDQRQDVKPDLGGSAGV